MIGGDANARLNGARAMMKTKLDATRHSRALLFFFASISAEDELDELENSADVRLFLVVCANRTNPSPSSYTLFFRLDATFRLQFLARQKGESS